MGDRLSIKIFHSSTEIRNPTFTTILRGQMRIDLWNQKKIEPKILTHENLSH